MEEQAEAVPKKGGLGCGAVIAIVLVLFILVAIGSNAALGYYFKHCQEEEELFNCMLGKLAEPEPEGAVTATGVYSYKGYSVTVTAHIPLGGGGVTGSVSGTCEGSLKGSYDGKNNGAFSGKLAGACSPFVVNIPASATFSGTVNKDGKVAPITFSGGGGGFTHHDSMTLAY